ncbi:MAG: flagellar basal body rod protein FlgB [Spirochaetaceae bacterium]
MFLNSTFGRTVDVLQRSMDVSLLRQDVIANNIANSDTPNFKRSEVNFETSLRDALESEQRARRSFPAALTNERHIPFDRPVDYRNVSPRRVLDYQTTAKNNGNNVDIEQESMDLLNNQLMYTLMSDAVRAKFSQINLVLQ